MINIWLTDLRNTSLLLQTKTGLDTLREMEKMLTSLLLVLLIVLRLTSLCEGSKKVRHFITEIFLKFSP